MSREEDEAAAGRLILALDEISPEKLKSKSHNKYFDSLLEVTKETLNHDGTRLMLIVREIKICNGASYKRDVLVEILAHIVKNDQLLDGLLLKPFGTSRYRSSFWREFANSLTSIPDIILNYHLSERYPSLSTDDYYPRLINHIISTMHIMSKDNNAGDKEHYAFMLQILGRIAMFNRELLWINFTSRCIDLVNTDREFKILFENVFWLPLKTDSNIGSFELFMDYLYLPIFHYWKPTSFVDQRVWSLLGLEAVKNEDFQYMICDKSILNSNYNLDKLRQKMILFNVFSYLAYVTHGTQKDKPNILMTTLHNILSSWSNATKILLRQHEHNRYLTWALLIGFRFAISNQKDLITQHAREFQSLIARAIPTYLSRSDHAQRDVGLCLADLVLTDLHKLISSVDSKASEMRFPRLVEPDKQSCDYKEAYELFYEDPEKIFKDVLDVKYEFRTTQAEVKRPVITKRADMRSALGSPSAQNKKVVDSDDEVNNDDNDDDEAFGEEAMHVPIYLRDCVEGLLDQNSNSRYVRLCLARATELVEKFANEQQELDTIKDVGVELARTMLYAENQFNFAKFEQFRMRILVSLCNAIPELLAKYLLEEFNGPTRSMRLQLDILQALVSSAQYLSTTPTTNQVKGRGKINRFAKFAPLYFYGIVHRLKGDFDCLHSDVITPQPQSVLSAFRAIRDVEKENENMLIKAIKMEQEKTNAQSAGPLASASRSSRIIDDKVLELEIVSDDSYLLSRILVSISMIMKCASQQPVLCKISGDLLSILKAYRCHPDIGVQKSIISCLKTMQECTPNVFFTECLEKPMMQQFSAWLDSKALKQ